ncbi:hypothetical protein PQC07_gp211 [Aeromonas phage D3]|uniref:Uncharacterized protein n=2 Tax=Ludhianavirus TaxID=3044751 RepID=A0A514TVK3_9CAUD|nr:hypothetical protein PQC07_gp211 [Aeromonas phage D3]YP_010668810.1 hypothetical protein PQC08_gp213 [Aeromonas phage D6]QDJ97061.1 hypothetical protein D3_0064 [Aeromonas phage D3]QDJ97222.1 hypothetical protein D6_0062 [Aeromonas phage D6]QEP52367.1 hypothetical protein D9_0160 [Aeromonas phage D9]
MRFTINELKEFVTGTGTRQADGSLKPVRPHQLGGLIGLKRRFKDAALVLCKKADVVTWDD